VTVHERASLPCICRIADARCASANPRSSPGGAFSLGVDRNASMSSTSTSRVSTRSRPDRRSLDSSSTSRTRTESRSAPRYWHAVYFDKLEPSPASTLPLERQTKLLKLVRENPDDGYAIFGAPQTGKSTVAVGLYAKVLYRELRTAELIPGYRNPVRRLSSKTMLDQQQAWAMRNLSAGMDDETPEPEVSRDRIIRCFEKQGARFRLFLEEIDKVRETEARRSNLFETLDTLHGCMGQFVMTSNLTPQQFSESMGGDFMHRVTAMCKIVNLYE
jgi:DNA replication protein DnaC